MRSCVRYTAISPVPRPRPGMVENQSSPPGEHPSKPFATPDQGLQHQPHETVSADVIPRANILAIDFRPSPGASIPLAFPPTRSIDRRIGSQALGSEVE